MLPLIRTEHAEADLAEIFDYLDEHSPQAAERLAAAIDERGALLSQFPQLGRSREELAAGLRSLVVERYVLFYRVTAHAVEILRILHGSRDIDSIMKGEESE